MARGWALYRSISRGMDEAGMVTRKVRVAAPRAKRVARGLKVGLR